MSVSQLVQCSFGIKLYPRKSVSMIHGNLLLLASISNQLICRDLILFKSNCKNFKSNPSQIVIFSIKSYSSNWIFKMCSNRDLNPNCDWDLPTQQCNGWEVNWHLPDRKSISVTTNWIGLPICQGDCPSVCSIPLSTVVFARIPFSGFSQYLHLL